MLGHYIKMSQAAIIGVVVLMMMSSSVGAVALMMGGDDDKKTGPTGPTGPVLPKARYVRLTFDEAGGAKTAIAININELRVLDKSGTNLALNKTVTKSSFYANNAQYDAPNAFDGNEETMFHTQHDEIVDWIEVDLGSEQEIAKIEISNEFTEDLHAGIKVKDRLKEGGTHVVLKNASGSIVKTTPKLTTTAAKYTIDFNNATPAWK
jgi:hypothetical protein